MVRAISGRLDLDDARARQTLEAEESTRSNAVRRALDDAAGRLRRRSELAAEAAAPGGR